MSRFSETQLKVLDLKEDYFNQFLVADKSLIAPHMTNYGTYNLRVPEGLLRSSYEIYFYRLLCEHNIKFEIDKHYPNSKLRYDFHLTEYDVYIEICPKYLSKNQNTFKYEFQTKTWGAYLLMNTKDFKPYLTELIAKND